MTWVLVVWLLVPGAGWRLEIRGEYQTNEACSIAARSEREKDLPTGIDDRMIACVDKASLKP